MTETWTALLVALAATLVAATIWWAVTAEVDGPPGGLADLAHLTLAAE